LFVGKKLPTYVAEHYTRSKTSSGSQLKPVATYKVNKIPADDVGKKKNFLFSSYADQTKLVYFQAPLQRSCEKHHSKSAADEKPKVVSPPSVAAVYVGFVTPVRALDLAFFSSPFPPYFVK
jgi:hypothetical protein